MGKSGAGSLARHTFRESHDVVERFFLGRITPAASATKCRPEFGRMNGNDGAQTGLSVVMKAHTLVPEFGHSSKGVHGGLRSSPH